MHLGTGWCAGCLRTLEEIGAWSQLDDVQKRGVWTELGRRREQWRWMQQAERLPGLGGN
jgi:uncharacterized protein